jgi:uncharacterized membrane protein
MGAPSRARVDSVDALRGIIMVLMALDHVRQYFGDAAVQPTNLSTTSTALFLTRWVTHICAPVFFLLTGTGAYLALRRMSVPELSRYLLSRGLWLVVLEFTFVRLAWQFNVDYHVTILTVMWAIGWAMITLGLLVRLPVQVVTAIGLVMIAGHNLFDGIRASALGAFGPLWTVLHAPGFLVTGRVVVFVAYVLVPWIGVTAVGFGLGALYSWDAERRRRALFRLGAAVTVAFVVIRAINGYGDPARWAGQATPGFTVLSFLNTSKTPPSLLFLLMTLGPALIVLGALDRGVPRVLRPALIIGKVPMFYFVLHILVIHAIAMVMSAIRFGTVAPMLQSPTLDRYPITQPPGWPVGLPAVYLLWVTVVAMLYPLCRWFAGVKKRRTDWWLSYM